MGKLLSALVSLFSGIGYLASLITSWTIFRRGEDAADAKETTEDLSVVQAERQADVSAPDTKAAIEDSLDKGTF